MILQELGSCNLGLLLDLFDLLALEVRVVVVRSRGKRIVLARNPCSLIVGL